MNKEFLKFLIIGALNSALTYIIYLLMIFRFDYSISYGLAYILGIVFSYFMNTIYVFKEKVSIKKVLRFPFVYLSQFLLSEFFLYLFVDNLHVDKRIAPLIVIIITVPITFLLTRYVIKGNSSD